MKDALFSVVKFLIVILLFFLGGLFLGLHHLPLAKRQVADWLLAPERDFSFLGYATLGIAFLLSLGFGKMESKRYLQLEMGGEKEIAVTQSFMKDLLNQFWKENFINHPALEVHFFKRKIEIVMDTELENLEKIEDSLQLFLDRQLGYRKKVFVSLLLKK